MMKSTVFEDWMIYASGGQTEKFEATLENIAENIESFTFVTDISEAGNVVTIFEVSLEDGREYSFPAYEICESTDGISARKIVEENYEVYINLIWRIYGIKPFMDFNNIMPFEYYLNDVQESIEMKYGKQQCQSGRETCSICRFSIDELDGILDQICN